MRISFLLASMFLGLNFMVSPARNLPECTGIRIAMFSQTQSSPRGFCLLLSFYKEQVFLISNAWRSLQGAWFLQNLRSKFQPIWSARSWPASPRAVIFGELTGDFIAVDSFSKLHQFVVWIQIVVDCPSKYAILMLNFIRHGVSSLFILKNYYLYFT